MSILVKSTPAVKPRTDTALKISLLYAGLLVVMAVTQLFTFEKFLPLIKSMDLPLGLTATLFMAPLIVFAEIFAVPFLLRMSLSPAFRYLSMFLGWLAAGLWLFISIWLATSKSQIDTVGFFGTLVNLMPGWWAVFISIALGILAAWSSWGLWPGKRNSK